MSSKKFILLAYALFYFSSSYGMHPEVVFLYKGPGANRESVNGIAYQIEIFSKHKPEIIDVTSFGVLVDKMRNESRRKLLVIPGGSAVELECTFGRLSLNDRTYLINEIRGGHLSYLGICAGAYFAANKYSVASMKAKLIKDGDDYYMSAVPDGNFLSDPQAYRLNLFGEMKSAFDSFIPDTWIGMKGVKVKTNTGNEDITTWNGGPVFLEQEAEVLATYSQLDAPAIVAHEFFSPDGLSRSIAIAAGVHFEVDKNRSFSWAEAELIKDVNEYFSYALGRLVLQRLGFREP